MDVRAELARMQRAPIMQREGIAVAIILHLLQRIEALEAKPGEGAK
jgi:hypothetical protein